MITLVGALILAVTETVYVQNPRVLSPDGEMVLVVRHHSNLADFERVTEEVFERRDPVQEWLDEYPLPTDESEPEPLRGALYRRWPSGHHELLSEFAFRQGEETDRMLVADDGHFVTWTPVTCDANAELLTIRAADGAVVRTLLASDIITKRDQQWLCRGSHDDVRWSIEDNKLRATVLVTDGKWDHPEARHQTIDIDLASGKVPAPERDLCPAALIVEVESLDGLLDRAIVRVMPEYPPVAVKARIIGRVRVDVIVGPNGKVETARVQPKPFGIDTAVKVAIEKWEFAPDVESYDGSLVFRFEIARPKPIDVPAVR